MKPLRRSLTSLPGFNPETQPVVPGTVLQPLAPNCVQLDFINKAFSCQVQWSIEPVVSAAYHNDAIQAGDVVPAAVFFPLVQRESGVHVLFTRRAAHLSKHAGQISFPGGRIDAGDRSVVDAALRETHEEIGIDRTYVQLIGTHPGFVTSTGYLMTPVIGLLKPGFTVRPNSSEVDEVFEVPLSVLMDPAAHRLHKTLLPDGSHSLYFSMSHGPYFIWGATAVVLRNFYHYLAAAHNVLCGNSPGR